MTKRRAWWALLATIVAGGVVAAVVVVGEGGSSREPSGEGGSSPERPDIVVVLVDTLRADHLGAYGHGRDTSPEIDALAERGLLFERAFAHSGWTLPSAGSLLTGVFPAEHGATRDPQDRSAFGRLKDGVPTLAETLGARGYRTGAFVNNVFLAPRFGLDRGFDVYDYVGSTNERHRSASATVNAALKWLEEGDDDRPAFALLHFMEPHLDYDPPSSLHGEIAESEGAVTPPVTARKVLELSEGDGKPSPEERRAISRIYDEEVRAVDAAIGQLASAIAERERPTWIWITSDHGEELWDHGGFEHGHHLHGELVRVPLVAVGPDVAPAHVEAPVQHLDLFRTLVRLGGAQPPKGTRGTGLMRVAADPGAVTEDRPIVHEGCLYGPWRAALTSGRWRVVVEQPGGVESLWRLDPHGQDDRLVGGDDVDPERKSALLETLYQLRGGREQPELSADRRARPRPEDLRQLRSMGYVQ